jgi:hypothetical protein
MEERSPVFPGGLRTEELGPCPIHELDVAVLIVHPDHDRRVVRQRPKPFLALAQGGLAVAPGRDVLVGAEHERLAVDLHRVEIV